MSTREHEEVSEYERQLDVPLLRSQPRDFQQENWLLDPGQYWKKIGSATWSDLEGFCDPIGPLWIENFHTYNGLNDKIPLAQIGGVQSSLRLLHVNELFLSVGTFSGNTKRRVQARFRY